MSARLFTTMALVLLAGCAKQPPAPDPSITGSREIGALFERWQKSFEAKDVDGVMSMYAPGATLTAYDIVPPLQYKGADAYRADYKQLFDGFDGPLHVEMRDTHIEAGSDVAFAYGLERFTGKLKSGSPFDTWMRYTEGLKRIGGQWKVVHEHISVPVDMATGKAQLDLKP